LLDVPPGRFPPADRLRGAPTLPFRSLSLGRFFGIDIFLHWSMWVLPLFVLARGLILYSPDEADEAILQFTLALGVYACLIFHEFAHFAVARWVGLRLRDLTFYPIGGIVRLSELSERPWKEVRVAAVGPLVHALIAVAIAGTLLGLGYTLSPRLTSPHPYVETFFNRLFWLNVLLAVLHVLPAFPMDGGRVFRGALALSARRMRATEVASMLSSFIALLFLFAGMVWIIWLRDARGPATSDPWWLIAMGIIIHVSGQQELMTVRYFASLQMTVPTLPTGQPIMVAAEQLINEEIRPREPGFTGVIWNPKTRIWVVWRNGQPIRASALVGD
jgi:Zn-dependent protease